MTYLYILLATLARALLAHTCGEALRLLLEHFAPHVPPLVCRVIGLLLAVVLIEIASMLWHTKRSPD